MKIFYKLNESKDWIGATETFIKDDKNRKSRRSRNTTYTIYFKKSLLCKQFKIMMNEPLEKRSFMNVTVWGKRYSLL